MREVPPPRSIPGPGALALAALLTLACAAASADTVHLLTGELFTGRILRFNDKEVSIELSNGGIITFKANQVERLRRWIPGRDVPEVIHFDTEDDDSDRKPVERRSGDVRDTIPVVSVKDWYVEPPPGFELEKREVNPEALRVWIDPIVQAKVVLTAHSTQTTGAEQLKTATHAELTSTQDTRVIRNQAVERGGQGGYRGWLLELEHSLTGRTIRQIQLFLEANGRTFVLSYTCPIDDYPSLARFFEESLTSFRVFDRSEEEQAKKDPPKAVELPPVEELPAFRDVPPLEDW